MAEARILNTNARRTSLQAQAKVYREVEAEAETKIEAVPNIKPDETKLTTLLTKIHSCFEPKRAPRKQATESPRGAPAPPPMPSGKKARAAFKRAHSAPGTSRVLVPLGSKTHSCASKEHSLHREKNEAHKVRCFAIYVDRKVQGVLMIASTPNYDKY